MAIIMDVVAKSGGAELPVSGAYCQARPQVMDKDFRSVVDEQGQPVLDDDSNPIPESYWYVIAELRWFTADPANGGARLRADPERLKLEIDPSAMVGNPIAALYARLLAEPGFETATAD